MNSVSSRLDGTFILGAGLTGLAVGHVSGVPIFEAKSVPGGLGASYYIKPGSPDRLSEPPDDGAAYRFEIGGGHWIFGGNPDVIEWIEGLVSLSSYQRRASVFFHQDDHFIPYPIQRFETGDDSNRGESRNVKEFAGDTMREWMIHRFGERLCERFFHPFNEAYTAGLYNRIAPQDAYKSPQKENTGYNQSFLYPRDGLNELSARIASGCDIHYGSQVTSIDVQRKSLEFSDGRQVNFKRLISTLPLNSMLDLCALSTGVPADPHTSVLVLNVGARKGIRCPDDHWIYCMNTKNQFHRIGFYHNVDESFLPFRERQDLASLYIERSFHGSARPSESETSEYAKRAIDEIQSYGFIGTVEVVDPTWVDVAYTWSWPGSEWRERSLALLEAYEIYQVGRYGRWKFQGMAESLAEGLAFGSGLNQCDDS